MQTVWWTAIYSGDRPYVKIGMLKLYRQPRAGESIVVYEYPTWNEIVQDPQVCIRTVQLEIALCAHADQRQEVAIKAPSDMTVGQFTRIDGFMTVVRYEKMREMERTKRG